MIRGTCSSVYTSSGLFGVFRTCLLYSFLQIPKKGKIYSVNEGNAKNWDGPTTQFVEKCKFPKDGSSSKSLRYIGRYHGSEPSY